MSSADSNTTLPPIDLIPFNSDIQPVAATLEENCNTWIVPIPVKTFEATKEFEKFKIITILNADSVDQIDDEGIVSYMEITEGESLGPVYRDFREISTDLIITCPEIDKKLPEKLQISNYVPLTAVSLEPKLTVDTKETADILAPSLFVLGAILGVLGTIIYQRKHGNKIIKRGLAQNDETSDVVYEIDLY